MKRKALKSIACLLLMGMAWSCSSESDTVMSDSNGKGFKDGFQAKSGYIWDDVIAEEVNGEIAIVADQAKLVEGLEAALARQTPDESVKILNLSVVRKIATNDSGDSAYFLIGGGQSTGGSTVSAALPLTPSAGVGGSMSISPGYVVGTGSSGSGTREPKPVSCWGCPTGCFLEYYNIDGHKVPYCDSAGCGPLCTKKED